MSELLNTQKTSESVKLQKSIETVFLVKFEISFLIQSFVLVFCEQWPVSEKSFCMKLNPLN